MNESEADQMERKLAQFNTLKKRHGEIRQAMSAFTRDDPNGPSGQGPFTGNTRESRRIHSLQIVFTRTQGGSPPLDLFVPDLHLCAYEFKMAIMVMLTAQLDAVNTAIAAL